MQSSSRRSDTFLYHYYTALKNELDRAFNTYEGEVRTGCWLGNLRERDNLVDPDIDGRII